MQKKVLFVCLGNICRSPMAMAIFEHLVKESGQSENFFIDSAGTSGHHEGESYHPGTIRICESNGVKILGQSRPVEKQDFEKFDYILAMDRSNLRDLQRLAPKEEHQKKIQLIREFNSQEFQSSIDVPDPYFTGNFEEVFAMLEDACRNFLRQMKI